MSDKYDKLTLTKKISIFCYCCMYRFNNADENVELIAFEKSIFWFDKSDKYYKKTTSKINGRETKIWFATDFLNSFYSVLISFLYSEDSFSSATNCQVNCFMFDKYEKLTSTININLIFFMLHE